jgi:hypothetical protein
LADAGFEDVKNLNRGMNFPYADILARKRSQLFLIGVKSRNEFQANGAINPSYNAILIRNDKKQLLERLGKTEAQITAILWDGVDQIAAQWNAIPAWVTVAMRPERGTYSAYTVSSRVDGWKPKSWPCGISSISSSSAHHAD